MYLTPEVTLGLAPTQRLALRDGSLIPPDPEGVPVVMIDGIYGQDDVDAAVCRATGAEVALVAVCAGATDEAARLAQINISERLRLEHRIATVLVEPEADRDYAAQLVLSGRADLVALPAPPT